jgi:hypothetical protein
VNERKTDLNARIAPQCARDLLIEIFDGFAVGNDTVFAFTLGTCIGNWIEDYATLAGDLLLSDRERATLLRGAAHLERHARMIRDALSGPVIFNPEQEPNI